MLTRLKVNGFKNLVDVDVRFGPFTCIAGVNGSGKSNLFDAIRFLSALAEKPLTEAALSIVRGSGGRSGDIRSLFHRVGDEYAEAMSFEAEMIVPAEGVDDLGRPIESESTLFRYSLTVGWRPGDDLPARWRGGPLEIQQERLVAVKPVEIGQVVQFSHGPEWRETAIRIVQNEEDGLLSTQQDSEGRSMDQAIVFDALMDSTGALRLGRLLTLPALSMTILSSKDGSQDPRAALARQEMRSWRVLHLNPAAMREPDDVYDPPQVADDGSNLAAALYAVAHVPPANGREANEAEAGVYARVSNRLFDLLGEVRHVFVDRNENRAELSLVVKDRDGTRYSARELSDGTLRFLALAVLEAQERPDVLCVEEPENGIHPGRIPALLDLLQAIAMDTRYPIEDGNPLRQIIVSTHSPSVVMRVPEDSLVMAELWPSHDDRGRFKRARFRGLVNTWRDPEPSRDSLALGTLLSYLNTEGYRPLPAPDPEREPDAGVRVMDRADLHRILKPPAQH